MGVPGGTLAPAMGLVPAWLTQNGEPPTKPWGPWSKLSALKSSTATPLPPAPMKGLVWWLALSKKALTVEMFWKAKLRPTTPSFLSGS